MLLHYHYHYNFIFKVVNTNRRLSLLCQLCPKMQRRTLSRRSLWRMSSKTWKLRSRTYMFDTKTPSLIHRNLSLLESLWERSLVSSVSSYFLFILAPDDWLSGFASVFECNGVRFEPIQENDCDKYFLTLQHFYFSISISVIHQVFYIFPYCLDSIA